MTNRRWFLVFTGTSFVVFIFTNITFSLLPNSLYAISAFVVGLVTLAYLYRVLLNSSVQLPDTFPTITLFSYFTILPISLGMMTRRYEDFTSEFWVFVPAGMVAFYGLGRFFLALVGGLSHQPK